MGDEGAANHTRLCNDYGEQGLEIFTFGRYAHNFTKVSPIKYPARHTFEASQAVSRLHKLKTSNTIFIQQNPNVIDLGVFHNDVIAVGNKNLLLFHEKAYIDNDLLKKSITQKFSGNILHLIEVTNDQVSIKDAIDTYLFNSQIISLNDKDMAILVPSQCRKNRKVSNYLEHLIESNNPINQVEFFDLNESMKNGGGPACLRLRVALTESELKATNPKCLLTEQLYLELISWVNQHYRDRLSANDLRDPQLLIESRTALDELTQILSLGSIYQFQSEITQQINKHVKQLITF